MNLVAAGRLACRGGWRPASRKNPSEVDLASRWRRLPVPPGKMPGSTAGWRPATTQSGPDRHPGGHPIGRPPIT
jgi:hypothetical protein